MKKFALFLGIAVLILSLAAPYGAVFASDALTGETLEGEREIIASQPIEDEFGLADGKAGVGGEQGPEEPSGQSAVVDEEELPEDTPTEEGDAEEDATQPVVVTPSVPKKLVISYVQASGVYGRVVEIRNVSSEDYHTKRLSLQAIRSTGQADVLAIFYGVIKAGRSVIVADEEIIGNSLTRSADVYFSASSSSVMNLTNSWLVLVDDATEMDSFCWAANKNSSCGDDYYPKDTLITHAYERCFLDGAPVACEETQLPFRQVSRRTQISPGEGYEPFFNACSGFVITEVAPKLIDQFIEIYNTTDAPLSLERCLLQVNTQVYQFSESDGVLGPGELRAFSPATFKVTLARTTQNTLRILDSSGSMVVDQFSYGTPQEKRSAIRSDDGAVVWTLQPTPGEQNEYVQYASCEVGYVRNEETGRCNKIAEVVNSDCGEGRERNPETGRCRNIPSASQLTPCREGQYRSEETNRCRSIATVASALKPCAENQFRNPATNRCKAIASTEDVALADCGEGRERNPVTNRCRNVVATSMPTADFAVEPVAESASVFIGWWILGGLTFAAASYAGWEWRAEISSAIRRGATFFKSSK